MDSSQRAVQNNGKLFFKFQNSFQIFGRKLENIQMKSEARILIKVQCVYTNGFVLTSSTN